MEGAGGGSTSTAFALLKQHQRLPVAVSPSSSSAAWGRGARHWSADTTSESGDGGDAMPRELRTLVGASFDVFARLSAGATRQLAPREVVRASRQYREALRTCVFAIEDRVELQRKAAGDGEAEEDEDEEFVDLLKVSLAIWHLCELLFLQRRPRDDQRLAYDLALWLQEHFAGALMEQLEAASAALRTATQPEQDPAYWSTLHSLAMAGCGTSAWSLLAAHSSYRALASRDVASLASASTRTSFQTIQRLLLSMPASARHATPAAAGHDDTGHWEQWHDECQYVLNTDANIKANAGLATLLRILAAEDDALVRQASSWYELMMARLFLEEPKRVAHRFEFLMASCFRTYNADASAMGNFECIILAILQYDVQSALQDIQALGFTWMAAHLVDLLTKSGAVADDVLDPLGVSLREFFLLTYAMDIGASSGLWQFALGYYESCPRLGLVAARSALEREPVPTDNKASRLIAYCQGKRGLNHVQRAIAARRARMCRDKKLYGAALVWMLRGGHLDDVDEVCEAVLRECDTKTSLAPLNEATEFLEAHPEMAQTPLLEWLVRYRELYLVLDDCESLRQQLREGEYENERRQQEELEKKLRFVLQEAARRVHLLVSSAAAPRQLRAVLLAEAEKLLVEQPTVYSSQHLYSLHAYLHQLDRSFDRASFYRVRANQQLKARVEKLLARNLCEAILAEANAGSSCSLAVAGTSSSSFGTAAAVPTAINGGVTPLPQLVGSFTPMDEDM